MSASDVDEVEVHDYVVEPDPNKDETIRREAADNEAAKAARQPPPNPTPPSSSAGSSLRSQNSNASLGTMNFGSTDVTSLGRPGTPASENAASVKTGSVQTPAASIVPSVTPTKATVEADPNASLDLAGGIGGDPNRPDGPDAPERAPTTEQLLEKERKIKAGLAKREQERKAKEKKGEEEAARKAASEASSGSSSGKTSATGSTSGSGSSTPSASSKSSSKKSSSSGTFFRDKLSSLISSGQSTIRSWLSRRSQRARSLKDGFTTAAAKVGAKLGNGVQVAAGLVGYPLQVASKFQGKRYRLPKWLKETGWVKANNKGHEGKKADFFRLKSVADLALYESLIPRFDLLLSETFK